VLRESEDFDVLESEMIEMAYFLTDGITYTNRAFRYHLKLFLDYLMSVEDFPELRTQLFRAIKMNMRNNNPDVNLSQVIRSKIWTTQYLPLLREFVMA
jgi:hypothetical protein